FGCQLWQPVHLIFGPAVFNRHILTFDVASFFEALTECAQTVLHQRVRRSDIDKPDYRHYRLLRACRERPRRPTAAQRDEPASPHSITSSVRASSWIGGSRRSALAVFKLMTSSNLVAKLDRQITGSLALENAIHVERSAAEQLARVHPVGGKRSRQDCLAGRMNRRQRFGGCQCEEALQVINGCGA